MALMLLIHDIQKHITFFGCCPLKHCAS